MPSRLRSFLPYILFIHCASFTSSQSSLQYPDKNTMTTTTAPNDSCNNKSNDSVDNAPQAVGKSLKDNPIHLGLGAKSIPMTAITGGEWYADYEQRMLKETGDEHEGRLMSYYSFSESWNVWEMHPAGTEIVMCTKGELILLQEQSDGKTIKRTHLNEGEYAINEPGVWHSADCVDGKLATVLFVTAGKGTQHKPRTLTTP